MSDLLRGKVAIVTGGGRGLGRAHALALARCGAQVVVNDLGGAIEGSGEDAAPANAVVAVIKAEGGDACADYHDISMWDQAGAVVELALIRYGRVDVIVNNAGVIRYGPIDSLTEETWNRTLAVNLTGTAALTHWAAVHWRKLGAESGRAVVNTTSPAGTNPISGSAAYVASKAGVAALTLSSALELAELGVRVNAIAPMARTRLTDAFPVFDDVMRPVIEGYDRFAPHHASPLVVYLASSLCKFTGRVFGCEGDDVYLFSGFSADEHLNNARTTWTPQTLAQALDPIEPQDRGFVLAPSMRFPGPTPSDDIFNALEAIARGDKPKLPTMLSERPKN